MQRERYRVENLKEEEKEAKLNIQDFEWSGDRRVGAILSEITNKLPQVTLNEIV